MTKLPVIASGLNSLLEVKKAGESSCEPCIKSKQVPGACACTDVC